MSNYPSSNTLDEQIKLSQYTATVADFVRKDRGCFIAVTKDNAFLSVLRIVLTKHLNLNFGEILTVVPEVGDTLKAIKREENGLRRAVLFMERGMDGQDLTFLVRQFKAAYPRLLIIVLTNDAEKQRIMYLHEVGADNFIAKPISAKTIIEKLAFTIRPQTKLGQAIDIAKGYLQDAQPEKAKQAAHQILEMKPGSAAGLMVLGDAEMALGNMDAAREAYQSASNNADMYLEPLRKLAVLAESTGNPEECLGYLEKLDKLSPLNSERKVNMGEIHLGLGNHEEAHSLFESAVDQVTKDALGQLGAMAERIAGIYAERDPARAESFLRRALSMKRNHLTHDDLRLFNQLGISLRQQGNWEGAIEEYRKALQIAPDDENLHYNLGMAYAEGKKFREARQCLFDALKLNDDLPSSAASIAYNMGVVFLQSDARDKARRCLSTALELDPGMENAKIALRKLG